MKVPSFIKEWCGSERFLGVLKFLFKVYFALNELNFGSFIRSRVVMANLEIRSGEKIFDAGCGVGLYSLRMAYKGANVVGGDLSPLFKYSMLLGDTKLLKSINFILMDLNHIPIKSKVFDKIICVDVLEHIYADENVMAELSRILKKNGELLIHAPNLMRYAKLKPRERAKYMHSEKNSFGHVRNGYTLNRLQFLFRKNNIRVCDYAYTFGFWSRIAGKLSSVFKGSIIIFPLVFFLALIDKASKTNKYNGGVLIKGRKH